MEEPIKPTKRPRYTPQQIFTFIYERNLWDDKESVSGTGSNLQNTKAIRDELPALFKKYEIRTLLDVACGDFNWLKEIDLGIDHYMGIDIVPAIIAQNVERYSHLKREFLVRDCIKDPLPKVDMILCRDCLVHLSYEDLQRTLRNFLKSKSTYLLTTTFVNVYENKDIPTGEWRALNLQKPPINFPQPLEIIDEKCDESIGIGLGKSLALWKLS